MREPWFAALEEDTRLLGAMLRDKALSDSLSVKLRERIAAAYEESRASLDDFLADYVKCETFDQETYDRLDAMRERMEATGDANSQERPS